MPRGREALAPRQSSGRPWSGVARRWSRVGQGYPKRAV